MRPSYLGFIRCFTLLIAVCLLFASAAAAMEIKGVVFLDENKNGKKDAGEKGLSGIQVSNQKYIVLTDKNGTFKIEAETDDFIFVIKPSNYYFAGKQVNSDGFYRKVIANANYQFALVSKPSTNNFTTLMIGDPQMRGEKQLNAFKEDIVTELLSQKASFASILGDIADDDLSIYPSEKALIKELPYPVYHVFGNHDIDKQASTSRDASKVFSQYYGPDYFSFNEGDVHFIVLNNVVYDGWDNTQNKAGSYFGGLPDEQYKWLSADLKMLPKNKLVVVMSHIPFLEKYTHPQAIQKLFGLLEPYPNLLLLSGHLHYIENRFLGKAEYWNGKQPLQSITIGAACGSWWSGPLDERGLPVATCMDGSPNGYFRFNFSGNKYSYQFIAANQREDFQMRITPSSDSLTVANLSDQYISINLFAASKDAKVEVKIDELKPIIATNYTAGDLFIERTYSLRANYDNWLPKKMETNHLWRIQLPGGLKPGIHQISVTAKDMNGISYKGYKLIEVK